MRDPEAELLPACEQYGIGFLPYFPLASGIIPVGSRFALGFSASIDGAGTDLDPILKLDLDGNLVDSFGAGLFAFPHGFYLDHEGYLWVTEGAPAANGRRYHAAKPRSARTWYTSPGPTRLQRMRCSARPQT